jgi:hypothetical protein
MRWGYLKTAAAWGKIAFKFVRDHVGVLGLAVSVTALIVSLKILSLQRSGNRPEMIFNRMELRDPYDDGVFDVGMQNEGTRTAYDYKIDMKTVDLGTGQIVHMETLTGSNPIRRQGGISAMPRLDMTKFLDVLALCSTYRDDDGNVYNDALFVNFPSMTRGLKKDKGGGGQYLAAGVSPDDYRKLEKMQVCSPT